MLTRFGASPDRNVSATTLMTCLMSTGEGPDAHLTESEFGRNLNDLADRVVKLFENYQPDLPWAMMLRGICDYRLGCHQEAISVLSHSDTLGSAANAATRDLFLAMSLHQVGRSQEAHAALEAARRTMQTSMPQAGMGDLGDGGLECWLWCHVSRREAEALISATNGAVVVPGGAAR